MTVRAGIIALYICLPSQFTQAFSIASQYLVGQTNVLAE